MKFRVWLEQSGDTLNSLRPQGLLDPTAFAEAGVHGGDHLLNEEVPVDPPSVGGSRHPTGPPQHPRLPHP